MKTLALAAALIAGSATIASADGYFGFNDSEDRSSSISVGTVTATAPGVVELYSFHAGERGALLGSEMVSAGANGDVKVDTRGRPVYDVIAVLNVDGVEVDTQEIELK